MVKRNSVFNIEVPHLAMLLFELYEYDKVDIDAFANDVKKHILPKNDKTNINDIVHRIRNKSHVDKIDLPKGYYVRSDGQLNTFWLDKSYTYMQYETSRWGYSWTRKQILQINNFVKNNGWQIITVILIIIGIIRK